MAVKITGRCSSRVVHNVNENHCVKSWYGKEKYFLEKEAPKNITTKSHIRRTEERNIKFMAL